MYVRITLTRIHVHLLASFFLPPKRLPKTDPRSHAHRSSTGTPANAVSMCIPHPTPAHVRTNHQSVRFRSRHGIPPFCFNRRFVVVVVVAWSSSSRTGPGWLITLAALHSSAHLVRRRPSLTSSASFSEVVRPRVGTENTQRCRP